RPVPRPGARDVPGQIYYWFGGSAVRAIAGASIAAIPSVRRAVGRFRPITDPADRRGVPAAAVTAGAIVGSSLLAGLAGIVLALGTHAFASSSGLTDSAVAVAVALLGGARAHGRRGGIGGPALAAAVV